MQDSPHHLDRKVYAKELELRVEHQEKIMSCLDLDKSMKDAIFVYELHGEKARFTFFIVCMTHLSCNIPSSIFLTHCIKYSRIRFPLTCILSYKNRIVDCLLIRENTGPWKTVFSLILYSDRILAKWFGHLQFKR